MSGLLAVCLVGSAMAGDRLEQFRLLARQYAEATDPESDGPLLSGLFGIADAEIGESLRSGGPFASAAFIRERLEAFNDEWGGASFKVAEPVGVTTNPVTLGLFTVTRGESRGSLRIYGRSDGEASLLAAVTHEGSVEVHEWPARAGASQFLASWVGAASGRGSWALHLELWQRRPRESPRRVWSSADLFPEGLRATGFRVKDGHLIVQYEIRYPGWKPGCADETEQEDVYRASSGTSGLTLVRRRVVNEWHRELQSAVTRLFDALAAADRRTLAGLVPDASLRARLPRELRPEPVCDERGPGTPAMVSVAATRERDQRRVPWALAWRRGPGGWRLAGAAPVLQ